MGTLRTVFHYLTLGIVDSNEEVLRKNTPCVFTSSLTQEDFEKLAITIAKPIKRLKVSINRQFVHGEVRSQSGLNTWNFTVDFNDFGKVTGNYWIRNSENSDSQIPRKYAEQLSEAIVRFLHNDEDNSTQKKNDDAHISDSSKIVNLIAQLSKLHDQGILTDDEYQNKKAELLKKI